VWERFRLKRDIQRGLNGSAQRNVFDTVKFPFPRCFSGEPSGRQGRKVFLLSQPRAALDETAFKKHVALRLLSACPIDANSDAATHSAASNTTRCLRKGDQAGSLEAPTTASTHNHRLYTHVQGQRHSVNRLQKQQSRAPLRSESLSYRDAIETAHQQQAEARSTNHEGRAKQVCSEVIPIAFV